MSSQVADIKRKIEPHSLVFPEIDEILDIYPNIFQVFSPKLSTGGGRFGRNPRDDRLREPNLEMALERLACPSLKR